ncbi:transcriptional regulator [Comamonas testosteroni]|uniref:transcriptional regulator n=1 Tax=Comamonas testosteroni TaxID=285 RepID=UPI00350E3E0E
MTYATPGLAVAAAADIAGSQAALARSLNVSAPTINQWAKGVRPVPERMAVAIESTTKGAVIRDTWSRAVAGNAGSGAGRAQAPGVQAATKRSGAKYGNKKTVKRMLRDWMKPRIKRVAGTWVCTGRGTTATGLGPWAAYSAWLMAQSQSVIYATKISAYDMALKVGPC